MFSLETNKQTNKRDVKKYFTRSFGARTARMRACAPGNSSAGYNTIRKYSRQFTTRAERHRVSSGFMMPVKIAHKSRRASADCFFGLNGAAAPLPFPSNAPSAFLFPTEYVRNNAGQEMRPAQRVTFSLPTTISMASGSQSFSIIPSLFIFREIKINSNRIIIHVKERFYLRWKFIQSD